MEITNYLLIGLALALLANWRANRLVVLLIASYWAGILGWAVHWPQLLSFAPINWSQLFNIQFSFNPDGLAKLFSSLIAGVGIAIFIYASLYYPEGRKRRKLIALLQLFAVSMWGVVIADNIFILYLFWELTTVSSYLLIQFNSKDAEANRAAFNGMFLTVMGGLAMLVGLLILSANFDTQSLQAMINMRSQVTATSTWLWPFALILLGAVTKSAQFPFYFWLTGAMRAPTPVSAYLHSATMVNAGVYLLARVHPLFGGLEAWYPSLAAFSMSTMLIAGIMSLRQYDLKALLACTTLFALGTMIYLLGGGEWLDAEAVAVMLLFHGAYKASLFMLVGILDRKYGTRDVRKLRGVLLKHPTLLIVALVNLAAMSGLPPLFGFVSKEMIFQAKLAAPYVSYVMMGLSLLSSMLIAAATLRCAYKLISRKPEVVKSNNMPLAWLCPMALTIFVLMMTPFDHLLMPLITNAVNSIIISDSGRYVDFTNVLSTWLSLLTVGGGIVIAASLQYFNIWPPEFPQQIHCQNLFESGLKQILKFAAWFTNLTQGASLSKQLQIIYTTFAVCLIASCIAIFTHASDLLVIATPRTSVLVAVLICLAAISLLVSKSIINNLFSFSVLGVGLTIFFVVQGAPDVAMAQLMVEILTVVIVVLATKNRTIVINKIGRKQSIFNLTIAIIIGGTVSILLLAISNTSFAPKLSQFFIDNSWSQAFGRNVVNVVLVDFRAFDTLGEALVILATAIGVGLLFYRNRELQK